MRLRFAMFLTFTFGAFTAPRAARKIRTTTSAYCFASTTTSEADRRNQSDGQSISAKPDAKDFQYGSFPSLLCDIRFRESLRQPILDEQGFGVSAGHDSTTKRRKARPRISTCHVKGKRSRRPSTGLHPATEYRGKRSKHRHCLAASLVDGFKSSRPMSIIVMESVLFHS